MAHEQFLSHCETREPFLSYQSAYRKHHSCELALIKLTAAELLNMGKKRVMALAATDLSAASDTMDQLVLLKVLSTHFRVSVNCFESCLSPRDFKVIYSSAKNLAFSVPRGSVLCTLCTLQL